MLSYNFTVSLLFIRSIHRYYITYLRLQHLLIMKFTATVLALIASTGIVSALPEAKAGGGWGTKTKTHVTSSAWTSSTCKAVYYTEVQQLPPVIAID